MTGYCLSQHVLLYNPAVRSEICNDRCGPSCINTKAVVNEWNTALKAFVNDSLNPRIFGNGINYVTPRDPFSMANTLRFKVSMNVCFQFVTLSSHCVPKHRRFR